jgi:hypothetical protein
MKIKFTKNAIGIGQAYFEGTEINCTEAFGNEMMELGYAIMINKISGTLPDDLPGRKILIANGFISLDEVKKLNADDLTTLKGIGAKLAENIVSYLNK